MQISAPKNYLIKNITLTKKLYENHHRSIYSKKKYFDTSFCGILFVFVFFFCLYLHSESIIINGWSWKTVWIRYGGRDVHNKKNTNSEYQWSYRWAGCFLTVDLLSACLSLAQFFFCYKIWKPNLDNQINFFVPPSTSFLSYNVFYPNYFYHIVINEITYELRKYFEKKKSKINWLVSINFFFS